jgi:TonB-dependent starch-binding outer membrane protein SusC
MKKYKFKSSHFFPLVSFLFLHFGIIFGQRTIIGSVTDATSREPLVGANIILKSDNTVGTVTDFEGKFSLEVPSNADFITITYVGYKDQDIAISTLNEVNVQMEEGEILQDVVVIGYGTVKREDATGSVQSITSESFNRGAITSPQDLIAGKIAGVSITTSGDPGGGAAIRIRGQSSINASSDPLIVIDGIPMDFGGVSGSRNYLNIINPNDIESMTVLKDASAAAIYGNRASGGVILITTKKGSAGSKVSFSYNGNLSQGQIAKSIDVLTGDEFRSVVNSYYPVGHPSIALLGKENTDWQKLIYQDAFGQDHSLSASGSIGATFPYRVSVGYTDKNGLLKTDNFNRYTGSLNINPKFFDNRLQTNFGIKASRSNNHFADRGAIGNALGFDPTQSPYDSSSVYGGFKTWVDVKGTPILVSPTNPLALLSLRDDNSEVDEYILNGSIDYRFKFLPALRANLNLGYNNATGNGTVIVPTTAAFAFVAGGVDNTYFQNKENSVLEYYMNYKQGFGKHNLDLMGGYSWQHFFEDRQYRNSNTDGSIVDERGPNNAIKQELYLVSLFSRLNYDFNDKYFLTLSLRRDGTSRFGPKNRNGLFPAAAVSMKVINNENSTFNFLKARFGFGVTGQENGGSYYAWQGTYRLSEDRAYYQFGDQFYPTLRPNNYNELIVWEENQTINLGVDLSIIRDRLNATIDVYDRKSRNAISRVNLPALQGLSNFGDQNIGTMSGKGIELSLNANVIKNKNISWNVVGNIAYNENKITKLVSDSDSTYIGLLTGGIAGGVGSNIQIYTPGYAPYSFYAYKQKYDENGKILENQFEDLNGDGKINESDKYRYKQRAPLYTIGLSSYFNFKNLDFSVATRANLGNFVYNNVQTDMGWLKRTYHPAGSLFNVTQSAVDLNVENQASLTFSDHFITDASFFKVDNMTLGYTFNNLLVKKFRLSFTAQNPIVLTKYEGIDPEIFSGIDNNTYPRPRTFLLGLTINFN